MSDEIKIQRSGGTFLGALSFFLFFFLLLLAGVMAALYIYRDHLIVEYVRQEGPSAFGVEVLALDSIVTRPVGQVSIELRGLVFQASKSSPTVRAEKVILSTPKNLLGLYQLLYANEPLPLKLQLGGLHVQALKNLKEESSAPSGADSAANSKHVIQPLPFAIDLETEFRDSTIETGPVSKPISLKGITGLVRTKIAAPTGSDTLNLESTGQLALAIGIGDQSRLPIRTDWSASANPKLSAPDQFTIQVASLTVSTLGMSVKSQGTIKWPSQEFSIEASGSTADLGVLPLDKAESEALGLEGRMKGSAEVSLKVSGNLGGVATTQGLIHIKNAELPFALVRESPKRVQLKGPVQLDIEAPFKISYDIPKAKVDGLDLQLATFKAGFTGAEFRIEGLLNKPSGVMMSINGQVNAEGETVELNSFEFRLANLYLATKGMLSLDPKRLSKLEIALTLPSLTGWPMLMPVLGTLEGGPVVGATEINQAKGSFALRAKIDTPLAAPATIQTDTKVDIELFQANGVEFPMNYAARWPKSKATPSKPAMNRVANGILRANIQGSGAFALTSSATHAIQWDLRRAEGWLDLKDLEVVWDDTLNKPRGRATTVQFIVASSGPAIKIERLDLNVIDSNASLTGNVSRLESGDFALSTVFKGRQLLSQIYELVPSLRPMRAKLPSGTFVSHLDIKGTYKTQLGPAGSPLTLAGRLSLKAPTAVFLDTKGSDVAAPSAAENDAANSTAASTAAEARENSFLKWPLVSKSKLVFDIQLGAVTLKTSVLKAVNTMATLSGGNLNGSISIANAFGGPVRINTFAINSLSSKPMSELTVSTAGSFQGFNLSLFGEFLNRSWKTLVGGISSGTFSIQAKPFSPQSLVDTSNASGTLLVKQGMLSTVQLDTLVNQKLTEYPQLAKLAGIKPVVATKGVNLDISSRYSYAKGRINLKDFRAQSPEKNLLTLDGWLQKDFSVDLSGQAYLADTPIGGSFREANSDKTGRLVVPIHITGSLKAPSLTIAEDAIRDMTKRTIDFETAKLKKTIQDKAGQLLEQKKKEAKKSAVDAVKEELKKRGIGF